MRPSPGLTPRERGCLSWAARGMTYQEIARVLDVSPRTVEQHLASARRKLGAYSTAQAVAIATCRHIITSPVARAPALRGVAPAVCAPAGARSL